jgi:hypothetical protein
VVVVVVVVVVIIVVVVVVVVVVVEKQHQIKSKIHHFSYILLHGNIRLHSGGNIVLVYFLLSSLLLGE